MEITGKIIAVLPERGGVSARTGNEWKSQEFVIETHDQYPKRCMFRVFGADRLAAMNIKSGEVLVVSFDIDAREYNGRWFNDVSAWKVDRMPAATASAPAASQAPFHGAQADVPGAIPPPPADVPAGDSTDDLPF